MRAHLESLRREELARSLDASHGESAELGDADLASWIAAGDGDADLLAARHGRRVSWRPGRGVADAQVVRIGRGTLVLVGLDRSRGHEQSGTRPCVGALYPQLAGRAGGLRRRSWALVDQLRCVDKRRVMRAFEDLDVRELDAIDDGLRLFLSL